MKLLVPLVVLCGSLANAATTSLRCSTASGVSSVAHVPTTTVTTSKSGTTTVTSTKAATTTVTPAHTVTVTHKSTTTIAPKSASRTNTVTTTVYTGTAYDVIEKDSSTTVTATTTVTTTVAPTTTTVAPSADFTPLRAQLSASGNTAQKRDAEANQAAAQYPTAVTCTSVVGSQATKTVTQTGKPSTVTATGSRTVTTTVNSVQTKTATAASTTTTLSTVTVSTEIVSNTYTVTVGTYVTSTVHAPVATVYAACSANNQVSSVNGFDISGQDSDPRGGYTIDQTAVTPYDCCVLGIQGNYAGSYLIRYYEGSQQHYCLLLQSSGGTCSFNGTSTPFYTEVNGVDNRVLSNGNCGHFDFRGPNAPPPAV